MVDQPPAKPLNHAGVWIPPPLLYVVPLLLARFLQTVAPLPFMPASIAMGSAVLCLIVGGGLCIWSIGLFRRSKTSLVPVKPSTALVLDGPYTWSRNPMYVVIAKEERYLEQRFGESYRQYKAQVRRWL